jgi:hypothetical protein
MALEARKALIETTRDSRGRVRHGLRLEVKALTSGSLSHAATILNLSETGFLLETSASLAIGDEVQVDLPHTGSTSARVMWTSDELVGCMFADRLPAAGVSAARLRGSFTSLAPDTPPQAVKESTAHPEQDRASAPAPLVGEFSPRAKLASILSLAILAWVVVGALAVWVLS